MATDDVLPPRQSFPVDLPESASIFQIASSSREKSNVDADPGTTNLAGMMHRLFAVQKSSQQQFFKEFEDRKIRH